MMLMSAGSEGCRWPATYKVEHLQIYMGRKERERESNRKITLDDHKSPIYLKCVSYLKGIPFKLKAFMREHQR